jgi:hypothetical protein
MKRKLYHKVIFQLSLAALLIALFCVARAFSQNRKFTVGENGEAKKASALGLPAQWEGIWKGTTVNITADGARKEIPMELHVVSLSESGNKSWKIFYTEKSGKTVRPYEIMPIPGERGRFVVDEKNGLFIENQLVGSVLYSQFMVSTNLVTTRFELKNDEIHVEMIMFDLRSPRRTKLTGGDIEVDSYKFRSTQAGILKREKSA